LKSEPGGWEPRNRYYKSSSSLKDITHIKNGNKKLIVTEGIFDLLSIRVHSSIGTGALWKFGLRIIYRNRYKNTKDPGAG
jgi:hypothetical protein